MVVFSTTDMAAQDRNRQQILDLSAAFRRASHVQQCARLLTSCGQQSPALPYWHEIIPHPKIPNFIFATPHYAVHVLRCVYYVFDVCNTKFTMYYGQILVWFGINYIPQGTIELILRGDFGPVR